MKVTYNRNNQYFTTYNVRNEEGYLIGYLEDHHISVTKPYFIAWVLDELGATKGRTTMHDTREAALKHIEENANK